MSGERGGLGGHAFHQVAIAADGVDLEVEYIEARLVVIGSHPLTGDGHAHAVAGALAEWSRGGFHSAGEVRFGMARCFAAYLTEAFDFVHRDGERIENFAVLGSFLDAREVQGGIKQHRSVSGGKDEAVTVWPSGIGRVVAQETLPERVDHRRKPHRRSRMP